MIINALTVIINNIIIIIITIMAYSFVQISINRKTELFIFYTN